MSPHRLLRAAVNTDRDWRAPIAAGAYLTMSVVVSVIVTFILGFFLFVRPIEHQADLRQKDTNAIAQALCANRERSLQTYIDPKTTKRQADASLTSADQIFMIIKKLSPHPPTECHGVDPYP